MSIPNCRLEVAFTTQPGATTQEWQDVSAYLLLREGVSITRGRQDEFSTVQAGSATFTLDNSDGRFTVGRASSPYYPNVKIGRACRLYTGSRAGNLLAAQDASFEATGTGNWTGGVISYTPATIARSTTRAVNGSASMLVTWPTAGAGGSYVVLPCSVTRGVQYTFSMSVWVVAGSPDVVLSEAFGNIVGISQTSSGTGAWQRLQITFTPTVNTLFLGIKPNTASTSGQTVFVDAVMLEEASTASTFTTTQAAAPSFTGYVDEWPIQWAPVGLYAQAQVTATDRFKLLGQVGEFTNSVSEEILYDAPVAYYMLGEDSAATTAGDTSKTGQPPLSVTQLGSGGTLEFGQGTGPGTDGLSAPVFTPSSVTNGLYLSGSLPSTGVGGFFSYSELVVFNTSTAAAQTMLRPGDPYGAYTELGITVAGKLTVSMVNPLGGGSLASVTSSASVNDAHTHVAHVTVDQSGGTVTVTLYLDGASVGSTSFSASNLAYYNRITVGGSGNGALFTGTLSHAALFGSALSAARVAQQSTGILTGFAGESSDARLSRYARWAGITSTSFESGSSTSIQAVDTNGTAPLQAMQDVVDTEGGLLFVDGNGVLVFHSRAHRFNATSQASFGAGSYGADTVFVSNDSLLVNDVVATREGGITFRAADSTSVADYGSYRQSVSLLTTSDLEVIDIANATARRRSQPTPRIASLQIDPLTDSTVVAAAMALDLGALIDLSGLPSQAPASTARLFIEGSTEAISTDEWTVTYNTSPADAYAIFILDDTTYGVFDVDRLGY